MINQGHYSIGFSSVEAPTPALPPYAENPQAVIDNILGRIDSMHVVLSGKADANRIRTLIATSDEEILLQASQISLVGDVNFLRVWMDQNGQEASGYHPSLTRIRGGVIQTEQIISGNWSPGAGSAFDLDTSEFWMGGSSSPTLYFDGVDLHLSGSVIIGVVGTPTLADLYALSSAALTEADLAAGVGNVLAGVGNNYVLQAGSGYVAMRHKDAVPFTTIGSYVGTLRTGMAISSNGIAMGYHRTSDGAWISSIVLDGTTGNVTMTGTLTASSVITSSVTLSASGTTLGTIEAQAGSGYSIQQKLEVTGTTVLKGVLQPTDTGAVAVGTITWNATTGALTGGTGIAITEYGIIGAASGVATFTIVAATGAATFAGSLSAATGTFAGSLSAATGTFAGSLSAVTGTFAGSLSAATGTFAGSISAASGTFTGNISTTGYVTATGSVTAGGVTASLIGLAGAGAYYGVFGQADTQRGVYGLTSTGTGVYGLASGTSGIGVIAGATGTSGIGLQVTSNGSGGIAINIVNGIIAKARVTGHLLRVYAPGGAEIAGSPFEYSFE